MTKIVETGVIKIVTNDSQKWLHTSCAAQEVHYMTLIPLHWYCTLTIMWPQSPHCTYENNYYSALIIVIVALVGYIA